MTDPRLDERRDEPRDDRPDDRRPTSPDVVRSWRLALFLGAITTALGFVVALNPTTSLNVVSVLLGILLLVSGLLYLVRAIDNDASHRAWSMIAGLVFVVLGVVLVRHLHVTVVLIALLVGISWIVMGVVKLMAASQARGRTQTWLAVSGAVTLLAGIVVVAVPINSVTVLTVLLGIWWIVLGILEIVGALALRRRLGPPRHVDHSTDGSPHLVRWPGTTGRSHRSSSSRSRS